MTLGMGAQRLALNGDERRCQAMDAVPGCQLRMLWGAAGCNQVQGATARMAFTAIAATCFL